MHSRPITCTAMAALWLLAVCTTSARSGEPEKRASGASPPSEQARAVIERGLAFLEKDAAKWRKERGCATCHHGVMTVGTRARDGTW